MSESESESESGMSLSQWCQVHIQNLDTLV